MQDDKNVDGDFSRRTISGILWNFAGQIVLASVAFFITPFIVHSLDVELYAIYVFTGVTIGYFSFLQLGLSTASIKFLSAHLAFRRNQEIQKIFSTSLLVHALLGFLGMLGIFFLAPFFTVQLLKIPLSLQPIAVEAFRIVSFGFLINLILNVMSSFMQAAGRFNTLNKIGVTLGVSQLTIAAFAVKAGFSLNGVLTTGVAIQFLGLCWYWHKIRTLYPFIKKIQFDRDTFMKIFKFGKYVSVSSIVGPFLLNIEKMFLTAIVSVSALTYYFIPFSLMDRLTAIRGAFSSVLFPAFSYLHDARERKACIELHLRSSLAISFLYIFFVIFFIVLGRRFLLTWLGPDFAERSTLILSIFSLAGLVNALAVPSLLALQGANKPQLPALFHITELIFYIPTSYFLIMKFAGVGAALAWFLRVGFDTILLLIFFCRVFEFSIISWFKTFLSRSFFPAVVCFILFLLLRLLRISLFSFGSLAALFLSFCIYLTAVWFFGLDLYSRKRVRNFLARSGLK